MGSSAVASFGGGFIRCLAAHVVHPLTQWNRNPSISSVYSYEQRPFQNKPPAVFETWFDLVEDISVVILFHVLNVALVLCQGFPATSSGGL
jgi:hypothetical protein